MEEGTKARRKEVTCSRPVSDTSLILTTEPKLSSFVSGVVSKNVSSFCLEWLPRFGQTLSWTCSPALEEQRRGSHRVRIMAWGLKDAS